MEGCFDDWFVVVKESIFFLIIIYGEFVISKRLSGHYKFEFTSRKERQFYSNAYELRMDCESAAEELRLVLETCSYVKFKTTKGKFFFRVVVENEVMATSKYSTELMVQKGLLK
jgi:uncharacterized protein YegP (UPF0339 family)